MPKFALKSTKTMRYAREGFPHLPQVQLYEGEVYDVPGQVPEDVASMAVSLGFGEVTQIPDEVPAPAVAAAFDPDKADAKQCRAFIAETPALAEMDTAGVRVDALRSIIKDYLAGEQGGE